MRLPPGQKFWLQKLWFQKFWFQKFWSKKFWSYVPAGLIGVGSLLFALALQVAPTPGAARALVFPPWWSASRAFAAAASSGAVIRYGGVPFIVVVAPGATRPAGAWAVVDPRVLGCGGLPRDVPS